MYCRVLEAHAKPGQVEEYHVYRLMLNDVEGLIAILRDQHPVVWLENSAQRFPGANLVVDHQYRS